jgi:hypothetical protein
MEMVEVALGWIKYWFPEFEFTWLGVSLISLQTVEYNTDPRKKCGQIYQKRWILYTRPIMPQGQQTNFGTFGHLSIYQR